MDIKFVDITIILFLVLGGFIGFKKGILVSGITFFGTLIVIGLAFTLKNPLSKFLYTHLPFINLGESYAGLQIINIIIYEAISFLFLVIVFYFLLRLIISMTGLVEKILKMTIVLGFASKVLGLIFGLVEAYIIVFVFLFLGTNFSNMNSAIEEGVITSKILHSTPGLANAVENETKALKEIYALQLDCGNAIEERKQICNEQSVDIMLKYHVLDKEVAKQLVKDGKVSVPNIDEIIKKYDDLENKDKVKKPEEEDDYYYDYD